MAGNELECARISMMARSISSNTRPDTLVRDHRLHSFFSCNARRVHTLGSSAFRPSTTAVSMSLAGSCFPTESAHRPFHHGIRRRGGTIFRAALPLAGPSGHANSPHPSSREGHHSTALVELEFPPTSDLVESSRRHFLGPSELAAIHPDAMHDDCQAAC